jgi:signal transduction histidine kinase
MRFDDMLATVLGQPRDTPAARISLWRQLVDVLAQRDEVAADPDHIEAFSLLDEWQKDVPDAIRAEAARSLAGRHVPAWLFAHFAEDKPDIARPVLLESYLDSGDWLELLPEMRPSSRALLRHRTDLDDEVREALDHFGAADMILESRAETGAGLGPETEVLELGEDAIVPELPEKEALAHDFQQIRDLVERIETFRRNRQPPPPQQAEEEAGACTEFRFETGPDGVIYWVDGAPRGPIVGQTIAYSADALDFGVDGHAAGAFRQRAPFRGARLMVAGEGPAAGAWRISAVPFFGDIDGRFEGYRGMARRPRRDEEAAPAAPEPEGLFGSTLQPDSLRQLIHELRTPLNAIAGFSEMIQGQLLGPVSIAYRERAAAIGAEAARLLQSVEDLDTAARAETDRLSLTPEQVDVAAILERLHDGYAAQAEVRGVGLAIRIEEGLPSLAADPIATERMIERLLSATVGLAASGETITVDCKRGSAPDSVAIAFSRPALLEGQEEPALLDPGYSPDGDWPDAPALGLGFALRLVRNIAQEAKGSLEIDRKNFVLHLPAKDASALPGERGR